MCPSGATCIPADCCFSELALQKSNSVCVGFFGGFFGISSHFFRLRIDFASHYFIYWILELFRQCGIVLLDFGTVPTVWYYSVRFWNCSDSVVLFC